MTDKKTEALKLALEALTAHADLLGTMYLKMDAVTAIREALAEQPAQQQEPWVGLTDDDDIIGMARDSFAVRYCALPVPEGRIKTFASAIEAKLKEKNNG